MILLCALLIGLAEANNLIVHDRSDQWDDSRSSSQASLATIMNRNLTLDRCNVYPSTRSYPNYPPCRDEIVSLLNEVEMWSVGLYSMNSVQTFCVDGIIPVHLINKNIKETIRQVGSKYQLPVFFDE